MYFKVANTVYGDGLMQHQESTVNNSDNSNSNSAPTACNISYLQTR